MVGHLQSKFPAMFQLYTCLSNREALPTPFEVKIACASKDISEENINKHLKALQLSTTSSIQSAFEKQTTVSIQANHSRLRVVLQYYYYPNLMLLSDSMGPI